MCKDILQYDDIYDLLFFNFNHTLALGEAVSRCFGDGKYSDGARPFCSKQLLILSEQQWQ